MNEQTQKKNDVVTFEVEGDDIGEFAECLAEHAIAFCFIPQIGFVISQFDEKAVETAWVGDDE